MERIANIRYGCPGTTMEIRVLRRWVPSMKDSEMWFLIVDKHGDAIQVLAQQNDQSFIEANFIVSRCYKIEDYACAESNDYQRMIQNHLHLNIGPASVLTEIEDNGLIPTHWFRFLTTEHLSNIDHKIQGYPDIIGIFSRKRDCNKKNREREPYLLLSLIDASAQEITITLWKECIEIPEKFNRSLPSASTSNTIIAVSDVKAHIYEEKLRLSSTSATHVYFDPPVSERDALLHRLQCIDDPLSLAHKPYPSIILEDLCNKDHATLMGKTFLCKAKIKDYKISNTWYNVFCNTCGNEIVQQGDHWFCTTDGKTESPRFSYNISALLYDDTGLIQAPITDNTIAKITGIVCHDIIQLQGYRDRKILPSEFQSYKDSCYNFHVQLGKWSTPLRRTYIVVDMSAIIATGYHMTPETISMTGPTPTTPSTDPQDQSTHATSSTDPIVHAKRQLFISRDDDSQINLSKKERKRD